MKRHRDDPALIIKPGVVIDPEIMSFASQHKIIITIIHRLGRSAGQMGCQCRGQGRQVTLAFLATKRTTHTPRFDRYRMAGNTQHIGHFMLYFAGMLGRGIKLHIAVLAGHRQRRLPFKIEMFLSAAI